MPSTYRSNTFPYDEPDPPFQIFLRRLWQLTLAVLQTVQVELAFLATSSSHRASRWRTVKQTTKRVLPWPPYGEIILILYWTHVLGRGEISAFSNSVNQCGWGSWESWPADASPYHLVLVADPQLVDPHTYPGRPWPLSTFTIRHTDQYLRRSFESVLNILEPSSVLFLGDLFDGGREWSTDHGGQSPEQRWRKYGETFWLKEYERFAKIFVDPWARATASSDLSIERRFRANLPGNHDLGISNGVQLPIRERFTTYFGEVNMMETLANHTVIMIDSVSLTAKAMQDGTNVENRAIWEPADTFLQHATTKRKEVAEREMRRRNGGKENELLKVEALKAIPNQNYEHRPIMDLSSSPDFPALLLSHVPLYRAPGTPCGPLREKFPPSKTSESGEPLDSDEPNALKVAGGYQYQNVLHPEITENIITSLGPSNIAHVFSGDDHDYCEILHRGYTAPGGGIREITVKSMSWAMGVRHPGFLLVSLWNPVDTHGNGLSKEPTVQTHLCLLPDQLGIFIYYLKTILITVTLCLLVSVFFTFKQFNAIQKEKTTLPFRHSRMDKADEEIGGAEDSSCSSSAHSADGGLASRVKTSRRNMDDGSVEKDSDRAGYPFSTTRSFSNVASTSDQRPWNKWTFLFTHFYKSLRMVAFGAFGYYLWLAYTV